MNIRILKNKPKIYIFSLLLANVSCSVYELKNNMFSETDTKKEKPEKNLPTEGFSNIIEEAKDSKFIQFQDLPKDNFLWLEELSNYEYHKEAPLTLSPTMRDLLELHVFFWKKKKKNQKIRLLIQNILIL